MSPLKNSLVRKALRQNIFGVALSQLLRQWRSWRTGSAAYGHQ